MTALSIARIVADELAGVGYATTTGHCGRARQTTFVAALPGFGVRTYSTGRRMWIVQRRIGGRMRTATIGNADVISRATALDVARRVLLRCDIGENPIADRERVRSAPSFAALLDEFWRAASPKWKPRTVETHNGYRRLHLDGAFAGKFVDQIGPADVTAWFTKLTDNSGPGGANRCLSILSTMMRKAEDWGYRPEGSNPCASIKRNRARRCERYLTETELARLGEALREVSKTHPAHVAAVSLLLLTGCRKSEILALTWGDVRGNRLTLRDSKTGPRTVWIGPAARAVIDRLPRRKPDDRVLQLKGSSHSVLNPLWYRLRAETGLDDVRLHDLRHSFASFAARRSETLPMIGKLLGHAKIASTARYAHLDDGTVQQAAERVGKLIAKATGTVVGDRDADLNCRGAAI